VVKSADWIVDLGPDGGDAGGRIVAQGRPEDVARVEASYTGQYLRRYLRGADDGRPTVDDLSVAAVPIAAQWS